MIEMNEIEFEAILRTIDPLLSLQFVKEARMGYKGCLLNSNCHVLTYNENPTGFMIEVAFEPILHVYTSHVQYRNMTEIYPESKMSVFFSHVSNYVESYKKMLEMDMENIVESLNLRNEAENVKIWHEREPAEFGVSFKLGPLSCAIDLIPSYKEPSVVYYRALFGGLFDAKFLHLEEVRETMKMWQRSANRALT